MKSNWLLEEKIKEGFGEDWGYSQIILQLFWNLGIKRREQADEFLNPKYEDLHDPFLMRDMARAIERIFLSKKNNEKVFVYGDYDADGVSGAVVLYTILNAYGIKSGVYIPHREIEGYGLNKDAIDYIKKQGGKLIITCDCGVSNNEEISYAKEAGIDVIVTDHHTLPKELSKDACAIIHPEVGEYPYKILSGGGVAFKLAQGILKPAPELIHELAPELIHELKKEAIEKWMLDVVAISTVADVMPLTGENRILVKYGLKVLNKTKRLGLRALIDTAGIELGKLNTYSIGFQIAPRINAAGRMDHANGAYELLVEKNEARAKELAQDLNKKNSERQNLTDKIVLEAKNEIVSKKQEKEYCLFAYKSDWPLGLLGLAAGKIAKEFYRPVVLLGNAGGKIKGSARGIEQFNIIEALQKIENLFEGYGGHPGAAGMTLKNKDALKDFEKELLRLAKEDLQDKELVDFKKVNEVEIDNVSLEVAEELEKFEPFGEGNRKPLFLSRDLEVRSADTIGNGNKHLRLAVSGKNGVKYKMIGFCFEHFCEALPAIGSKIDAVYEIGINEWNGSREVQLKIVDIAIIHNT